MRIHQHLHLEDLNNEDWLHFLKSNGMHPELYFRAQDLDSLTSEDIHAIDRKLLKCGLQLSMHAPSHDLAPGASDAKVLELTRHRFCQALNIAEILRPILVNFHAGYDPHRYSKQTGKWLKLAQETWGPLVKKAEAINTVLTLENERETEPSLIKQLVDSFRSPHFRHCFDIGHFHIFHTVTIKRWWAEVGRETSLVHIHDNRGEHDEHLAMGHGNIPFPTFFDTLKDFKHEMTLTIENFSLKDARRSLHQVRRYLRLQ